MFRMVRELHELYHFTKILERVVLKKNIYDLKSGFRSSYSTDTCLTYVTDYIRFQMDKGFYTGMVMIDLQKAF